MDLKTYLAGQGYGSASALARAIGSDASSVCNWAAGRRLVPAAHAVAIERVTCGKVLAHELRPDLDWLQIGADVFVKVGSMYNLKE